ncbi:MAG: copper amine oxidase N-terminal domain-containing protein, partial [Armatimonadota bacterium]
TRKVGDARVTQPAAPTMMAALPDAAGGRREPVMAKTGISARRLPAIVKGGGQRATMPLRVVDDLLPTKAVSSRGERFAMLPRVTDVPRRRPERTTVVTSSGQRITEPAQIIERFTHIAHIGDKQYRIVFDGDLLRLRTPPTVRAGFSITPFREVFEHTGGVVNWYPLGKRVEAKNDKTRVQLQIGNPEAQVNDDTRMLELAPYIDNGRTMVPLDFMKEILNVTVRFNPKTGAILITSNEF